MTVIEAVLFWKANHIHNIYNYMYNNKSIEKRLVWIGRRVAFSRTCPFARRPIRIGKLTPCQHRGEPIPPSYGPCTVAH